MVAPQKNIHAPNSGTCEHDLIWKRGLCRLTQGFQDETTPDYSVQFSHSVVSDSLRPHGLQHARLPCPSLSPGACSNSSPLSRWCHPTIASSAVPFSSCLQCFPASGSFPMSQLFISGGQSFGVSALASVLPIEHPGLISFRMDWLDLLVVLETLKSLLQHHSSKASILHALLSSQSNSHIHT